MTKRRSETTQWAQSPCTPQPTKRTRRRPRTESFLRQKANHYDVLQSCSYIQSGLAVATNSRSSDNSRRRKADQWRVHPNRLKSAQLSEKIIRKHVSQYEQKFQSHCRSLNAEANATVNLRQGFYELSEAIDSDPAHSSNADKCELPMLHTGAETTAAIKRLISQFAGVASTEQVDDMRQLKQELSQFC